MNEIVTGNGGTWGNAIVYQTEGSGSKVSKNIGHPMFSPIWLYKQNDSKANWQIAEKNKAGKVSTPFSNTFCKRNCDVHRCKKGKESSALFVSGYKARRTQIIQVAVTHT